MKKLLMIAIVCAVAVIGGWMILNQPRPVEQRLKLAEGALLLDVRTSEEYQEKHGEKAFNIPLVNIEQGVMPQVAKNTPIYVYCRSGNRSAQATTLLRNAGFTRVTDIGAYDNLATYGVQTAKMEPRNNPMLQTSQ